MRKEITFFAALAICAPLPLAAQDVEQLVKARIGYQNLLAVEMAGLSAMVRGDAPYDAEAAQTHADNLVVLSQHNQRVLFPEGTSNADLPGQTRALPAIWADIEGYVEAERDFARAAQAVQAVAGDGLDGTRPLFAELGGTCRACHSDFRAEDY